MLQHQFFQEKKGNLDECERRGSTDCTGPDGGQRQTQKSRFHSVPYLPFLVAVMEEVRRVLSQRLELALICF